MSDARNYTAASTASPAERTADIAESVGATLRKAREKRGVSLPQVSRDLCLKEDVLRALESRSGFAGMRAHLALRGRHADELTFELRRVQQAGLASRERAFQRLHLTLERFDLRRRLAGVKAKLIAGDGLAATALKLNGPPLMKALRTALEATGFSVGKPLFVKFARIGVQDEIGVITKAKSTLIVVGERPGLGTGDSLSIYTAFAPRLGQDNSEKDCISNVRDSSESGRPVAGPGRRDDGGAGNEDMRRLVVRIA